VRVRVLDLYCCQGAATRGYELAGMVPGRGVDIDPQPRFPYPFTQADAVEYVRSRLDEIRAEFGFIHASPPCQHDSDCQRIQGRAHPDLIGPTREVLEATGLPYVIENVGGAVAKLRNPVELCGSMFGLRTYRHRYFEAGGWTLTAPEHPQHTARQTKMGRAPKHGEFIHAVGNFSGVETVRQDWGVPWMNRDGIREAIPPAYTKWIGDRFTEWSKSHG
jgi:DNA (cytosine-5)-methyltransferase 1